MKILNIKKVIWPVSGKSWYIFTNTVTVIPGKFSNPGMKNPSGWGWLPDVKMNILIFATIRFVHDDEWSHSDSWILS